MAVPERPVVWLACLLLLLAVAVVFYALLPACGLWPLQGWRLSSSCPGVGAAVPGDAELRDAAARTRALEDAIRQLELELIEAGRCPEPGPVAPRLARPADPPPFLPRIATEPPATGSPTAPVLDPPGDAATAPPAEDAPSPAAEPPSLDAERWEEQDISILEGCWQLDSNYTTVNVESGERRSVTDWQLCLDSNGTGEQTMVYEDGTACRGPAQGSFDPGGQLILTDTARIQCDDGAFIYERVTTCERAADGTASCVAVQPGRDTRSAIRLRR